MPELLPGINPTLHFLALFGSMVFGPVFAYLTLKKLLT